MKWDPYDIDDYCRCTEGILNYKTQKGRRIIRRFFTNPFKGKVKTDAETSDERQWNEFIKDQREALNDETWDPVQFTDGSSTYDWMKSQKGV